MTHSTSADLPLLRKFLAEHGIALSDAQVALFWQFRDALYAKNEVMNLTRVAFEDCELRHFVDSLLFVDLIPSGASVLDIGTGPGLPAWPIAAARPDCAVTALDSSGKMLGFLRSRPLPNLEVVEARMEDVGLRETHDVVTGRALAPLALQLELSAAACRVGGVVMPMRSALEKESIAEFRGEGLGLQLEAVHERALPGTDVVRLIPAFRKAEPTHPRHPRKWADMKRKPLA